MISIIFLNRFYRMKKLKSLRKQIQALSTGATLSRVKKTSRVRPASGPSRTHVQSSPKLKKGFMSNHNLICHMINDLDPNKIYQ